jgi:hypothetical protein
MNPKQNDDIIEENDQNSFLVETTFNSDIGLEIRKEIDEKFKNSKVNQNYIFPRIPGNFFNRSRRNLSNFRSKNRTNRFDTSQKQQEILKIYSREQLVLKQMYPVI